MEKEIREFLERLQSISKFVAQLINICKLIFQLLKKGVLTIWNEDCQFSFKVIKLYLSNPLVFYPPQQGKPLILYLTIVKIAIAAMLAQYLHDSKKECHLLLE